MDLYSIHYDNFNIKFIKWIAIVGIEVFCEVRSKVNTFL